MIATPEMMFLKDSVHDYKKKNLKSILAGQEVREAIASLYYTSVLHHYGKVLLW